MTSTLLTRPSRVPDRTATARRYGGTATVADTPRIYYLHPLLAGSLDNWPDHFARCAALGFTEVIIAPPFEPGAAGNVHLTRDHHRLHQAFGTEESLPALVRLAEAATACGLSLLIDIAVDRVAADAPLVQTFPHWFEPGVLTALPDPRVAPGLAGAALFRFSTDQDGLLAWWSALINSWLDTGLAGLRCHAAHRVPSWFWQALIAGAKRYRAGACFIASTFGASVEERRDLSGCGFDFAECASWAWDLRAPWLAEDIAATLAIGPVIAMAESPFGRRLAAAYPEATHGRQAAERSLRIAASLGVGWLHPMGFEYGARQPLDPVRDRREMFDRLAQNPTFELSDVIREVNASRAELGQAGPAELLSTEDGQVASLLRAAEIGTILLLANRALDRPAHLPLAQILPRTDGMHRFTDRGLPLSPAEVVTLGPGEVRLLHGQPSAPIIFPDPAAAEAVTAAIRAPRLAIEAVSPAVDGGRFAIKRLAGEVLRVEADIICDGHDQLGVALRWRAVDEPDWQEQRMVPLGNDRWTASFPLSRPGRYLFAISAWKDVFATFRDELAKKHAGGVPVQLELREGKELIASAASVGDHSLAHLVARLAVANEAETLTLLLHEDTARAMQAADRRPFLVQSDRPFPADAERRAASFASWYELFPRSQSGDANRHGTFADVIARLPAVAAMGFDTLYFPPIHPIGRINRKGRNNALRAAPDDPGSPYAIGGSEGGHDAIHPELGSFEDFRHLIVEARRHGLEIALDFAIQCSPDHPWLAAHPEWFSYRADGSIRFAENPPKKYEDIVNVDFYAQRATPSLWLALRDVVLFWVEQGIRLFRVDNPHTKPLPFWEWMIADIRGRHPDVIFLAEAFTRPKLMYRLAKVGFSQSYTYFTWRNTAWELREYLTELTTTAPRDFFRPHFFVNTPDINPLFLQTSGRPGFLIRAALAATLSGLWGVYNGFELCEAQPLEGREEYRDSEKYQLRVWDWQRPGNIVREVTMLNRIRRANPALQSHLGLIFLASQNDSILAYMKATESRDNIVIVAVSLDPHAAQTGGVSLPDAAQAVLGGGPLDVEDLMHGGRLSWQRPAHTVHLDPTDLPFAIWRVTAPAHA